MDDNRKIQLPKMSEKPLVQKEKEEAMPKLIKKPLIPTKVMKKDMRRHDHEEVTKRMKNKKIPKGHHEAIIKEQKQVDTVLDTLMDQKNMKQNFGKIIDKKIFSNDDKASKCIDMFYEKVY